MAHLGEQSQEPSQRGWLQSAKMDQDKRKSINLMASVQFIQRPSYWLLLLPNWNDFGAHLHIRTLVCTSLYLIANVFNLCFMIWQTVLSYQRLKTFNDLIDINIMKITFIACNLVAGLGHIWYLIVHYKVQSFLKSFSKLESKVSSMETCGNSSRIPAFFSIINAIVFFNWVPLVIFPAIITIIHFVGPNSKLEQIFIFELDLSYWTRHFFLIFHLITYLSSACIMQFIEYVPLFVYGHEAYLINRLKCACIRTFEIVQQRKLATSTSHGIVDMLNKIWANYERLSALNESTAYTFGVGCFMGHSMNFVMSICSVYVMFQSSTESQMEWPIYLIAAFVFSFRLMFSIVTASKLKTSCEDFVSNVAALLSQNINLLEDEEKIVAKFFMDRIRSNELAANVMDLYRVDKTLILPLISLALSTILLLSNKN